jgi:predicted house-cleaning noncanonical NTP pyrophosphatase (MazG superfamily)
VDKIVRLKLGIDDKRLTAVELDSEEGLKYLKKKLVEEAVEVQNATTHKEICEELGDLLEILYIFYVAGYDKDYVDALRTVKCEEKGDFVDLSPSRWPGYLYVLDKK